MRGHGHRRVLRGFIIALLVGMTGNVVLPDGITHATVPGGVVFTVTTQNDELDAGSCTTITSTSGSGGDGKLSLREAICEASNTASSAANPNIVNVPAGEYDLTDSASLNSSLGDGAVQVGGAVGLGVKIVGATNPDGTPAVTVKQVDNIDGVFETPFGVAVGATFQNLIITGGNDGFGGGGLSVGSNGASTTVTNCQISGNTAPQAAGGIYNSGGDMTITNSTIKNNTAGSGAGGISFTGGNFSMDNSVVSGNTGGGGADISIPGATIAGHGGGLYVANTGTALITHSTITGNAAINGTGTQVTGGPAFGGGLDAAGNVTARYNRIVNNTVPAGDSGADASEGANGFTLTATDDWWGINTNPVSAGLVYAYAGTVNASPWLELKTAASPSTVNYGHASILTASFLSDSANNTIAASDLTPLLGLPVTWANVTNGSLSNQQTTVQSSGTATATLTTNGSCNNASAEAKVDNIPDGDTAATATVTVQCPDLSVTKTDNVNHSTPLGGNWNWSILLQNAGPGYAAFSNGQTLLTDSLPNSSIAYGTPSVSSSSGVTGTITCNIDASDTLSCTAAGAVQINSGATITVTIGATPSGTGTFANPRANGTCSVDPNNNVPETNETNNTCSDTVTVTASDLTLSKSNDATNNAVSAGNSWNWTLTAANSGNGSATFSTGQKILQDDMPQTGVTYGTPSVTGVTNVTNASDIACTIDSNQTLTCTASGASVTLGATTGTFQVVVPVTSTSSGTYTNPRSNGVCRIDPNNDVAESNENNNDCTPNTVTVNPAPPTITKAFGAASIPVGATTTLTFTLTNPTVNSASATGVAFTDMLPSGMTVAATPGVSNTCGGSVVANANGGSVSLSNASIGTGTSNSCTLTVNVTGTSAGNLVNTTGNISSTNGGSGSDATASIVVVAPPTITKAFGTPSIPLNGSTSLTFTIINSNQSTNLSGVGFSDTLPAGLVLSTPNGLTGTCGNSGTITATSGSSTIGLSGGAVPANGQCQFAVNVTGVAAGTQTNVTSTVSSNEGGAGAAATASIDVEGPPSIAKSFNPTSIAVNGTTTLTFTITNPAANPDPQVGVSFTDTLPSGLAIATPNGLTNTCGGTPTATPGSGSISLTGGSVPTNSTCQIAVTVVGDESGVYTNTTGKVSSINGGTGNVASANLDVASAPTIVKAFGTGSIPLNGTTSLTFTIQNPNALLALTGVAFTDALPSGLAVASTPGVSSDCGGTVTASGGGSSISLTGGTVAMGASCAISLTVTGTTQGTWNNTTGAISANESGQGATSNTASLIVVGPPSITKAFAAPWIFVGHSTSLTFTITNSNLNTALSGVGFSDTLPSGLAVSTPNGLTGTCGSGTIAAAAGGSSISLSGGSIPANGSCMFSVSVTGEGPGNQVNTTGNVTSSEGGSGGTATASVQVYALPSIVTTAGPDVVGDSGAALTDSAVLSGGYNPSGTITFYLFGPGVTPNGSNSNTVYSDTVTVTGDGTYSTSQGTNPGGYLPVAPGQYQWVAVYSGDSVNPSTAEAFGKEPESSLPELTVSLSLTAPYTAYTQAHIYSNATVSGGTVHGGTLLGVVRVGMPLQVMSVSNPLSLAADPVILATSGNNTEIFTGFSPPVPSVITDPFSTTATYTTIENTLVTSRTTDFLGTSTSQQQTYNSLVSAWNNAESAIKQPYLTTANRLSPVKTFACLVTADRVGKKISASLGQQLETYAGEVYQALGGTYTGQTLC